MHSCLSQEVDAQAEVRRGDATHGEKIVTKTRDVIFINENIRRVL